MAQKREAGPGSSDSSLIKTCLKTGATQEDFLELISSIKTTVARISDFGTGMKDVQAQARKRATFKGFAALKDTLLVRIHGNSNI